MALFDFIPETYLIDTNPVEREACLQRFRKVYNNDIWIIKPGEGTNRGHGICIQKDLNKIISTVTNDYSEQYYKTVILQKYI